MALGKTNHLKTKKTKKMKKKIFVGFSTLLVCCTMFFSFNTFALTPQDIVVDEVDTIDVRWRRDRFESGTLMQCVSFSLRKCEYVIDL
jgi:hypothetical protein